MPEPGRQIFLPAQEYDLAATLTSGQAFRWNFWEGGWEGVIGDRWVRLVPRNNGLLAETATPAGEWSWLTHYLQSQVELDLVLRTFPQDEPMRLSVAAARGLRLLRQDPWECLASFILSSTKQIVQIQQIVSLLCLRFGEAVPVPAGHGPAHAFPSAARVASLSESALRDCKMGFRAPNLLATAQQVARGAVVLDRLATRNVAEARAELVNLPGVGPKIANCVLLFAYGFQEAFPVDVWVQKALRELYFPKRRPHPKRLQAFVDTYFGPNAGYAQQYLFHYMRRRGRTPETTPDQPAA